MEYTSWTIRTIRTGSTVACSSQRVRQRGDPTPTAKVTFISGRSHQTWRLLERLVKHRGRGRPGHVIRRTSIRPGNLACTLETCQVRLLRVLGPVAFGTVSPCLPWVTSSDAAVRDAERCCRLTVTKVCTRSARPSNGISGKRIVKRLKSGNTETPAGIGKRWKRYG